MSEAPPLTGAAHSFRVGLGLLWAARYCRDLRPPEPHETASAVLVPRTNAAPRGAPPLLAELRLAYFSNLNDGTTHYGTGSAPVFFDA